MYLKVKVTLKTANPRATRVIALDPAMTLDRVHAVLQSSFDWFNSHLHQFTQRNCSLYDLKYYIYPGWEPDMGRLADYAGPEEMVKIGDVLREAGDFCWYEYDFGDSWEHRLELVGTAEPADHPYIIEGSGTSPEEDSRGEQPKRQLQAHPLSDDALAEINAIIKASLNTRVSTDVALNYGDRVGPFFQATWERALLTRSEILRGLFDSVQKQPVPELTPALEEELAQALAPWTDFLDEAANEIPLTQAGYLAPKFTAGFVQKWQIEAYTKSNREVDIPQMWAFHEVSKKAGLTRKYRSTLRLSTKGKAALKDLPDLVRRLVAASFAMREEEHQHDAIVLGLMLVATGAGEYKPRKAFNSGRQLETSVAELLGAMNWRSNGNVPDYSMALASTDPFDRVLNPLHTSVELSPELVRYCAWLGLAA